jgi:3-oxoacyl-(acyl-carrier-protein) synthase
MARRVVVTGMGQVSALGLGVQPFFDRLLRGESGIASLDRVSPPGLPEPIGGAVPGWCPEMHLGPELMQTTWRTTHLAYVAAKEALASAGLDLVDRPRGGVFVGTGFGAQGSTEETYQRCFAAPGVRPRPDSIIKGMSNATAGILATEFRLLGPNLTLAAACASANHAIGHAFHLLCSGRADMMLAGGVDAPLTNIILGAWASMRLLAPAEGDPRRACRPFNRDRKGMAVSEGAAFLVLETWEAARARDAVVLAEVVGYAANADGGHITRPDPDGIRRCMRDALGDAGVSPDRVDYVSAHGTATLVNDYEESRAIWDVLGPRAQRIPVSSTKAVHGHAMGASGALEAIATIMSMRAGVIPPTAHLDEVDPELPPLDYVRGEPRERAVGYAVSNSFGFGGTNAVLVLKRGD